MKVSTARKLSDVSWVLFSVLYGLVGACLCVGLFLYPALGDCFHDQACLAEQRSVWGMDAFVGVALCIIYLFISSLRPVRVP